MELDTHRNIIKQINLKLLDLLKERKNEVLATQKLKSLDAGKWSAYAPGREWQIFTELKKQLITLELKELFCFGIMMEAQCPQYPAWSEREHLEKFEGKLFEQINPLLLKMFFPDLYEKLHFSAHFKHILATFSDN